MLIFIRQWFSRPTFEISSIELLKDRLSALSSEQTVQLVRFATHRRLLSTAIQLEEIVLSTHTANEVVASFYQDRVGPLIIGADPLSDPEMLKHYEPGDEAILDRNSMSTLMYVPAKYHDIVSIAVHERRPTAMVGHDADWLIGFRYQ